MATLKKLRPHKGEKNDCAVVAIQQFFKMPYREAHQLCSTLAGRKPRETLSGGEALLQHLYLAKTKVLGNPTIKEFAENNKWLKAIVHTKGHVCFVYNGKYHDTFDSGNKIVDYYFYEVYHN